MNGIFFLLAAVLLLPACCTTVGAAGVFLMRPTQEPKTRRMLCGMAAGIMLAASEVPRIAQQFGLDTSVKVNMMSVVHATTTAVNLTRSVAKAAGK